MLLKIVGHRDIQKQGSFFLYDQILMFLFCFILRRKENDRS